MHLSSSFLRPSQAQNQRVQFRHVGMALVLGFAIMAWNSRMLEMSLQLELAAKVRNSRAAIPIL